MSEEVGSVLTGNPVSEDTGVAAEPVTETAAETETETATELTTSDWVSEEYNDVVSAKGWKSADDVLKSYVNLEKQIGTDKVTLPQGDEDLSEWDGWEKLGTPKTADEYDLNVPQGFEQYETDLSDWFREEAHKAKLPASMAQKLHDSYVQKMMDSQTSVNVEQQRQVEDWNGELKKEYGGAYDERVGLARRALRSFGSDELSNLMNTSGLGNHPEMIRAFSRIGAELSSGQQFKDSEQSGQFGTTPDMAKEQIAQIRANPALYDTSHSENKILNNKLTQLTEVAYGNDVLFATGGGR
tara:strand:- start:4961 stop:5854 length:894 start_codon:yes stop_codon:yes gene_type:complete